MPEEDLERRRFGRIRGLGDDVIDAARSITGQSTGDKLAEFTDAYTEVVTGLDEDLRVLQRRTGKVEATVQRIRDERAIEITGLRRSVKRLSLIAVGASTIGVLAVILAFIV